MNYPFNQPGGRDILGLFAGLLVAVVTLEALMAAANYLIVDSDLNRSIAEGTGLSKNFTLVWFACWAAAGLVGSLMATSISGSRTTGCILGTLLMAPALILSIFAGMPGTLVSAVTVTPLVSAGAGAWAGGRIHDLDSDD